MLLPPWRTSWLGLALLASTGALSAQTAAAPPACSTQTEGKQVLSGNISDATGARITSATVLLTCADRTFQARTDSAGHYMLTAPAGQYRLRVEATGFGPYEKTVSVDGAPVTLDLTLSVENASNSVMVSAESGYVATDSAIATKTNTPLLETPQSISVITRDLLDAQGVQSINEALRYAPGLVAESQGNNSSFWTSSSLQLRGFIPDIYQDGLTDDTYGNTLLDSYFYQRIEILEGPSSVLYGQGNPAGIVDVETKRPVASTLRELQLGFGSFGRYEGNFDFSGPLASTRFLYRLTGVGYTEGTQTDFIDQKRLAIAPALTWLPDSKTSLVLLSNYTYNPEVGAYAAVPAVGTVLPNPNGKIPVSFFPGDPNFNQTKQSFVQAGDVFTRALNDTWRVDQNFRFTGNRDLAHMIWPIGLEPDNNELLDRYAFTRHVSFNSILSDNRISKVLNTGWLRQTLLAGVNYTHYDERWNWGDNDDVAPINVFHPVYHEPISAPEISGVEHTVSQQTGIYFQDQAAIKGLRLSFGGRQDWLTYDDTTNGNPTHVKEDKFTLRTGAVYMLPLGIAPYFSYATSFQPDLALGTNGPLPPTTGQQYEGGIKYQPAHTNMLITAALYDLAQQNVGEQDPQNPNFEIAVGEIRSRGFELRGQTSLAHRINVVASYAYTSSKYTRTTPAPDGTPDPSQGKYQYGVPLNTASLWTDYNLPLASLHGLGVSAGSRFVGASWGDNVNSFNVPGATLFDAGLHYDFDNNLALLHGARLQVNASNLGNRTYVASCYSTDGCYYGIARAVYGTVRYRW